MWLHHKNLNAYSSKNVILKGISILKRLYTRKSACNARLVCAVTRTGGCTKSFASRVGLARHLIDEYGEHWYRYGKLINNEGEPQGFRRNVRPSVAPDLDGSYNIIGRLVFNRQTFAVLDAPHDGSCFYHSLSSMIAHKNNILQNNLLHGIYSNCSVKQVILNTFLKEV